jgi:hypothetical protein
MRLESELGGRLLTALRGSAGASVLRRLPARVRLEAPVPADLMSAREFEVRKISRTGMLVETDLAAELDSEFEVEVALDGHSVSCRGRIAYLIERVSPGAGDPRFELGVEFVALGEPARRVLEEFITHLAG